MTEEEVAEDVERQMGSLWTVVKCTCPSSMPPAWVKRAEADYWATLKYMQDKCQAAREKG